MNARTNKSGRPPRGRVLLVTHHYAPENVAPARRWSELVERLTAAGFGFGVLAPPAHDPSGSEDDEAAALVGTVTTGTHSERIVRTRFRRSTRGLVSRTTDQLVAALSAVPLGLRHFSARSVRPDVVVGTVPGIPSMFAAWVLARCFRARFVVEMRDAWPDLIAPSGMLGTASRIGFRRAVRAFFTRVAHRAISHLQTRADLVVTTTETFGVVLRSRGQRWVEVVRNGTHDTEPALALHWEGHTPDRPGIDRPLRAVYLGTTGRSQSLEAVIRAAAELSLRGHKLEVRIVGRGSEWTRLGWLAAALDAPVTVEPPVSHAEALDLYRWADTAVVALHAWAPFEWTIPSKVYEVIARGVPVTAALSGEAADLVRDLGAGVVVPPDDVDALVALWSSWCEAGALPPVDPRAGTWVRENATWDVLADRYGSILDTLIDR